MQAQQLVEFAFQRYYRLDCSSERGLCERHARTSERVSAALRPAVQLAQTLKDLNHPQDQAWMKHLLADAALNRFKHLEAGSGLRANAAPMGPGASPQRQTSLEEYLQRVNPEGAYDPVRLDFNVIYFNFVHAYLVASLHIVLYLHVHIAALLGRAIAECPRVARLQQQVI